MSTNTTLAASGLTRRVFASVSLLGLLLLTFVAGAAVMYFDVPPAEFLTRAFMGTRAYFERAQPLPPRAQLADTPRSEVVRDVPDKTFDGFTLYTTGHGSWAVLLDMRGNVVHDWKLPYSKANPGRTPSLTGVTLPDEQIYWFRAHAYPNGDLLAVYHAFRDTPYGYGLVKLDKNSNLVWMYPAAVHHSFDVDGEGRIYTLTQETVTNPPPGVTQFKGAYLADFLVVLSPDGEELLKVPVLEAFLNSDHKGALDAVKNPEPRARPGYSPGDIGDWLHTNSVRVLSKEKARGFREFEAGQVLLSLRTMDTLAVLDTKSKKVVWARSGPWKRQHDASFLDSGNLLLFDNLGRDEGSRVIEYNPVTRVVEWSYTKEDSPAFAANVWGTVQRLPNGNTLLANPQEALLYELTPGKKVVWECRCGTAPAPPGTDPTELGVTCTRRYGPAELKFLTAKPRP